MTIGIDLVEFSSLEEMIRRSEVTVTTFLTLEELETAPTLAQKAGIFAAKEAVIKTGYCASGEWHKIIISHLPSGKPIVVDSQTGQQQTALDISISHSQQYVVAIALYNPS